MTMRWTVSGLLEESLLFNVVMMEEKAEGSLLVAVIGMKLSALGSEIVRRFVKSNEWQKGFGIFGG